jgi:hypothetical protein
VDLEETLRIRRFPLVKQQRLGLVLCLDCQPATMEMEKKLLKKLCRDNDLYVTPAINDKLYLHYKVTGLAT